MENKEITFSITYTKNNLPGAHIIMVAAKDREEAKKKLMKMENWANIKILDMFVYMSGIDYGAIDNTEI